MSEKTLFQRIENREIPSEMLYEDEECFVIRDINPKAPTHFLVIPRKPVASLDDLGEDDVSLVGHLVLVAKEVAAKEGLSGGYRTVFNCGADAFQTVPHIHLHVLGGRKLDWPPG